VELLEEGRRQGGRERGREGRRGCLHFVENGKEGGRDEGREGRREGHIHA